MWRATGKLLRLQLRLSWNTFKHRRRREKIAIVIGNTFVAGFTGLMSFGAWGFVRLIHSPALAEAFADAGIGNQFPLFLDRLPLTLLTGAFLMGLLVSITVLVQTLYLSGDIELLLSAPIPVRSVFLSKLLQASAPAVLFLGLIAGPPLVGIGLARQFAWPYYPAALGFLALLVFGAAALSALAVMVLVRIIPARRLAEAIGLIAVVSFFTCSQTPQLMISDGDGWSSADRVDDLVNVSAGAAALWNPAAWTGRALLAWAEGDWTQASALTALTLAGGLGFMAVTVAAAERLYLTGWSRLAVSSAAKRIRRSSRRRSGSLAPRRSLSVRWIPAPVLALVAKDFRLFRRDLRNLTQLILPIVMAVVWGISFGRMEIPNHAMFERLIGGLGLFMGVTTAWGFAWRFGLGAFSLEGKCWWIIKTRPVQAGHLLAAKFIVAYVPSVVIGASFVGMLAGLANLSIGRIALNLLILSIVLAGITGLMLAFGILTAKFDWRDPREVQGGAARGSVIMLVSLVVIFTLLGVFLGLPAALATFTEIPPFWANAAGIGLGTMISIVVGAFPLAFASGRIETMGQESG